MPQASQPTHAAGEILDELIAGISERLQSGQSVDIEECCRDHPELADQLRRVLPAILALAELGHHPDAAANDESAGGTDGVESRRTPGTLGDFRILCEIGRGGMGVVYEAEQHSLNRRVALKVLPFAAVLDPRQLQRFKNEALAAAQLDHPHIVDVYGVGCERGVHYYAMRFIEGETLADVIRQLRERESGKHEPKPLERPDDAAADETPRAAAFLTERSSKTPAFFQSAARLGRNIAEALDHAHQHGIVHRDVKPSNVMLDRDGKAWVTDFGLAHIETGESLTMTGDVLGTLRYMSPEQALGERRLIDHRTDVYSLGATLYELATLQPLFPDTDRKQLLHKIACEEPARPSKQNAAIPADLETILLKATAKDPQVRYVTARELADDLGRFLEGRPIQAKRTSMVQRVSRWARRHLLIVGTAAALLLAVAIGSSVSAVIFGDLADRNARLADDYEISLINAKKERRRAERAEVDAKRRLFEARLSEARAARWSRRIGQRFRTLKAVTDAAELARQLKLDPKYELELRNQAIAALALADIRLERQWDGFPAGSTSGLAFDADLTHYARSDGQGNVSVRRVTDDRELARLPGYARRGLNTGAAFIRFSPSGGLLAVRYWHRVAGGATNFQVWDWRRKRVVWQPSFDVALAAFDFSPEGTHLALGQSNGTVTIHAALSGDEVKRIAMSVEVTKLAYSPHGGRLAIGSFSACRVHVHDARTGKRLQRFVVGGAVCGVAWHPRGRLLAAGCGDANVHVWNTATRQRHALLQGHHGSVVNVAFSPDGDRLLSHARDGTNRLWDVWTGRELLRFGGEARSFSRDGRRLALLSGDQLILYNVSPILEYRGLPSSRGAGRAAFRQGGFSPDGRWLALGTDKGLRLFDTVLNTEAAFVPLTGREHYARFHPSGKVLLTSGPTGLRRWPVRVEGGTLRLGPPQPIAFDASPGRFSFDRQGRILAICDGARRTAAVIELDHRSNTERVAGRLPHVNVVATATSPDGRSIATGTHNGFGLKVWDAKNRTLVAELLPQERQALSAFSPDGELLAGEASTELSLWNSRTWRLVRRFHKRQPVIPVGPAFAPDGILAWAVSNSAVELIEPRSGRTLARLEDPDPGPIELVDFSPDGGLLVIAKRSGGIKVWDLPRIRRRLKKIGLDWGHPPIARNKSEPAYVELVPGDLNHQHRK
jgi:eukaryotic-like serine/threonine-protein kinase